jgi:hypothetical protein
MFGRQRAPCRHADMQTLHWLLRRTELQCMHTQVLMNEPMEVGMVSFGGVLARTSSCMCACPGATCWPRACACSHVVLHSGLLRAPAGGCCGGGACACAWPYGERAAAGQGSGEHAEVCM